MFAFLLAQKRGGDIIWAQERWRRDKLHPRGIAAFFNPSTLILCRTGDQTETLVVAEDSLRSGAVTLVVLELSKPLGLTQGRRLQLAAREGHSTGLALISGPEMGSNATETRWHCQPVFDPVDRGPASALHRWDLMKNKSGPTGSWHIRWDGIAGRHSVVPPVGTNKA